MSKDNNQPQPKISHANVEDIKKALECCQRTDLNHCLSCPYNSKDVNLECCDVLMHDALEYIEQLSNNVIENIWKSFAKLAKVAAEIGGDIVKHKELCDYLHETYKSKNADYGNSFKEMFAEFGIITAITRIGDKFNRLKNLYKNQERQVKDESVRDTLLDMANYCIMTVMEIDNQKKTTKSGGKK